MKKAKEFDCVRMKDEIQARLARQWRGLSGNGCSPYLSALALYELEQPRQVARCLVADMAGSRGVVPRRAAESLTT